MVRPQLADWRAENIRFSYFYEVEVAQNLREGLWKTITGLEPDSIIQRPSEGVRQEQGAFGGGLLTVAIGVDRLDFIFSSLPSVSGFPSIGSVEAKVAELYEALAEIRIQLEHAAVRLAHGFVSTYQCDSRASCYQLLDEMLSRVAVDENSRDFFYQVNFPRASETDKSIVLNCLSRWSVIMMNRFSISNGAATRDTELYALRVETDFNNAPATSAMNSNHDGLLKEMIASSQRILTMGDR